MKKRRFLCSLGFLLLGLGLMLSGCETETSPSGPKNGTVTATIEADISLTVSHNGTVFTFTADSTYSDFIWAIDGITQNEISNVFVVDTAAWLKGFYELTVEAQKDGDWRSATVKISVEDE
jgi:hypothetical protein